MAEWTIVIIAVVGLIYNSIVTHAVLKNDVKHLIEDVAEIKVDLKKHILKDKE